MTAKKPFCLLVLLLLITLGMPNVVSAQNNKQRGATWGGLAGAVAGGIIGDNNDKAGAGAVIGGVVGAVAGGLLGNAADKDAELARQRAAYYHAQQQQYARQQQTAALQSAVTLQDVIAMSRSGLSDQVVVNQVRQRGYLGKLAVSDIIALHEAGVSENVITTLQTVGPPRKSPVTVARPAPAIINHHIHQPAPIIIEQHAVPHYPQHHYRHARRHMYYYYH